MEIKDIENLAELSKLELSSLEKESLLEDLKGILEYVKQIKEVKVEETETEDFLKNVWREDLTDSENTSRDFSREELLSQFPDQQDGFVKVKKILE